MPNPLIRSIPLNTSKEPQRQGIEPVPEEYEGDNNPYRGIETHGVEPTVEPREVPGHGQGRMVTYEAPEPEPEPIPVVIRQMGGRELRRSRVYRAYATASAPAQIVGRDDNRSKVKIKNLGASDVYIGDSSTTANAMHSWPLAQGEDYESNTQDTLYAMSSHASDSMQVSVMIEYSVEL
jgi:hypothetical protein